MSTALSREFVTAGRAIFTIQNPTGEYYTYRVNTPKDAPAGAGPYFVSLLTGSDNENDYTYIGMLDKASGNVRLTKASKYQDDTKPVKVIRWALANVWNERVWPDGYSMRHEGRCGVCGRTLTTPESLDFGIGPECRKNMHM
jgi:hypothetical protein